MEHVNNAPTGAGRLTSCGTEFLRPDGWRKATAGLLRAENFAAEGRDLSISKTRAVVAAKRVGAHIGLKAADLLLLDTLSAFTQPQDWEAGQRPIVWASNAYLMGQTGFSLSTLKRHARRLVDLGIVAFKDSANGKRWGHRDADGVIVEAYGFDLSPLSARVEEFEALAEALAAERALCQRLRRQITIARRSIRARLEAAQGRAEARFLAQFEALLAQLPGPRAASQTLGRLAEGFLELLKRVEELVLSTADSNADVIETQNMNPKEVISDPHILITKQPYPVDSNSSEKEEAAGVGAPPPDEPRVEAQGVALDLPTVVQACPEFTSWAHRLGGYLKDWGDLHRVACELRPMIGISEHAWNTAQDLMGMQKATAALVLVFEKHSTGEVSSPGGYLRGMVEKSGGGELHLERSFYGRLTGLAA